MQAGVDADGFTAGKAAGEMVTNHDGLLNEAELAAVAEEKETHSFEVDPSQVQEYMVPFSDILNLFVY